MKPRKGSSSITKTVDARGLACPQPVVLTKKALQGADKVVTIVDNSAARENVSRLAKKEGCKVEIEEKSEGTFLQLTKTRAKQATLPPAPNTGPTVVVMSADNMGRGSEELGRLLVRTFLHTLNEVEPRPDKMIFFNSGVKLTAEGSPVIEDLQTFRDSGIEILVCGTCLEYYELKNKVAVGEISNMYTIAETLLTAGRTVTI